LLWKLYEQLRVVVSIVVAFAEVLIVNLCGAFTLGFYFLLVVELLVGTNLVVHPEVDVKSENLQGVLIFAGRAAAFQVVVKVINRDRDVEQHIYFLNALAVGRDREKQGFVGVIALPGGVQGPSYGKKACEN
jgi:hypothetical protein